MASVNKRQMPGVSVACRMSGLRLCYYLWAIFMSSTGLSIFCEQTARIRPSGQLWLRANFSVACVTWNSLSVKFCWLKRGSLYTAAHGLHLKVFVLCLQILAQVLLRLLFRHIKLDWTFCWLPTTVIRCVFKSGPNVWLLQQTECVEREIAWQLWMLSVTNTATRKCAQTNAYSL